MKIIVPFVIVMFLSAMLLQGCEHDQSEQTETSATPPPDTLVLRTHKVKGKDLFGFGGAVFNFTDTIDLFPYPVNFPTNMTEVRASRQPVDFAVEEPDYIDIVAGNLDGEEVFVVDQNDNQDFTDDPVRQFQAVDGETSTNSILCYYQREKEGIATLDSSWIQIGLAGPKGAYRIYGRDEHLQTEVTVGGTRYLLGAMDRWLSSTLTYGEQTTLAIFAENGSSSHYRSDEPDAVQVDELIVQSVHGLDGHDPEDRTGGVP